MNLVELMAGTNFLLTSLLFPLSDLQQLMRLNLSLIDGPGTEGTPLLRDNLDETHPNLFLTPPPPALRTALKLRP